MTRSKGHRLLRGFFVFGALLLCLLGVDYAAYPYGAPPVGRSDNQGQNGLWVQDTWYFGQYSPQDTRQLAQRLQSQQISFLFCHVRGVQNNGTLRFHFPMQATCLVQQIHQSAPSVKVIAWIYAGDARAGGHVDLSRPRVRQAMAREAHWLTTTCGFDGVQWDYEICPNHDMNFLSLLQETRMAMPSGKLLSVAAPLWLPEPLTHWGWSSAYYTQVARQCDQIAVMGYDSGIYLPRGYVWLMAQQVEQVTQAVSNSNSSCHVLIGIPTYQQGGLSHDAHSENITFALRGVRQGLTATDADRNVFSGVAIFADNTTRQEDWRTYRKLWLIN
jgi:spore germination protein YaaH